MKRFLCFIRDIAFIIFILALCGMIFIMSTGKRFTIKGYQVLRVLTSSMEPVIPKNTCIIIKEAQTDTLEVGDIITFISEDPNIQGYYNTHRIYEIRRENGQRLFITKGDAIAEADEYPVHEDMVVGIFERELPGGRTIGKIFIALSDSKVYFIFVILPLVLCMLSYFWQIVGLVRKDDEEEEDKEAGMELQRSIEDEQEQGTPKI